MSKKSQEKISLVITSCLSRITDFQIQSENKEFFDDIEGFREYICAYLEPINNDIYCKRCGCTELLCGHNKRE